MNNIRKIITKKTLTNLTNLTLILLSGFYFDREDLNMIVFYIVKNQAIPLILIWSSYDSHLYFHQNINLIFSFYLFLKEFATFFFFL